MLFSSVSPWMFFMISILELSNRIKLSSYLLIGTAWEVAADPKIPFHLSIFAW